MMSQSCNLVLLGVLLTCPIAKKSNKRLCRYCTFSFSDYIWQDCRCDVIFCLDLCEKGAKIV